MEKYAVYNSQFGNLYIAYDGEYITKLSTWAHLSVEKNEPNVLTDAVFSQILEYLDGKRQSFDFPCKPMGTPFQLSVWSELCKIPYGETRSYKDIATAIGNPKASRAVGMANNKNPIAIAIPCHRVIGANGKMVGYGGGLAMKIRLLEIEKAHKNGTAK